jgi:hypothetical protein
LLDAFDQGWTNIGEEGRKYWVSHSKLYPFYKSNSYIAGLPYADFRRDPLTFAPYLFKSWTAVLEEMRKDRFNEDPHALANKAKAMLGDVFSSQLSRLNPPIFNVPPMPYSESRIQNRDDIKGFQRSVADHLAVQIMEKEMTG